MAIPRIMITTILMDTGMVVDMTISDNDDCPCRHKSPETCPCEVVETIEVDDDELQLIFDFIGHEETRH